MPYFYHYTDYKGIQKIIRSGKIQASLGFMASGDACYGNGVYLTKLKPESFTKAEIAMNNWTNAGDSFIRRTEYYFVLYIPDSDIKDITSVGRNIFLFGHQNDLLLHQYPWWLKNHDSGQIISSYKYEVSSRGPVSLCPNKSSTLGLYRMTEDTVNGRPVYKFPEGNCYLFMGSIGAWIVGDEVGKDRGFLSQRSNFSLGPRSDLSWEYYENNQWNKDDATLRADAWQK